jgi:hypothetical protein
MPRNGRNGRELIVIFWRDIPAQVNAQEGRDRHQVILSAKFQRAVDRAKRKANIYTADEDIAQWRRESRPIEGDLAAEAKAAANAIEHEYRRDRLGLLAYYGGWEADVVSSDAIDKDVLAALEELDEEDEQDEQETQ